MDDQAQGIPRWGQAVIAAMLVVIGLLAYAYIDLKNKIDRNDSLVIVNTSEIAESIRTGRSDMTAKEVADKVRIVVNNLASEGKVVIRGEAVWAAPDHLKLDIVE
ncbi:hypothetical protein [Marinobacter sp. P4B1]|uniref:hypothetical protein n=1 Tax=Marinobacter sp. P4B1 TaxID=1119533 RepID=UPI00071CEAA0|nr:hypothetical protein [Marinobacter sp. P4B1]KRW83742.1 hypothetical protein AQ621_16975 [Marinobacter sp. P4B1]